MCQPTRLTVDGDSRDENKRDQQQQRHHEAALPFAFSGADSKWLAVYSQLEHVLKLDNQDVSIGNNEEAIALELKPGWDVIASFLSFLDEHTQHISFVAYQRANGRGVLMKLLSLRPPLQVVQAALRVFENALDCNPAAFFMACAGCSNEVITHMVQHVAQRSYACPFPWLFSRHISFESCQVILDACPQGVWLPNEYLLQGECLVDYLLFADEVIAEQQMDLQIYRKFKLVLLAADYCRCRQSNSTTCSPVHLILSRVLDRKDFFTKPDLARHVVWLLHQLSMSDRWVFEKVHDNQTCLDFLLEQQFKTENMECAAAARHLCRLLLEMNPSSAGRICPSTGRHPIHKAIAHGWPCHDLILCLCPDALNLQDPASKLCPFQVAAIATTPALYSFSTCDVESDDDDDESFLYDDSCHGYDDSSCEGDDHHRHQELDVLYELLRANPMNVQGGIGANA